MTALAASKGMVAVTMSRDIHAAEPRFAEEARIAGVTLRFSRLIRGIGGACDVVLCATEDGREVVALASEWPRVDVLRSADGSLGMVTRTSPDSQKIALYRSLFRGREDAYASGYLRRTVAWGTVPLARTHGSQGCATAAMWGATSARTAVCMR